MHQQQPIIQGELQYQNSGQVLREEDKIPLFLLKLWNIVEDQSYFDIIRWDDSGYSFHIIDPYSFCRNVLPQYFKHNNLNSLIRQLNMYGFRKMTPIERTSLARAESDQDHLEFSHPYFVRDYPHLLSNIKRKSSSSKQLQESSAVNLPSKDLNIVFEELKQLRDRQKNMEYKMNSLVKENETIWHEMDQMRTAHLKQQQIVNKLVHFLVSLVHPNKLQRLGKRQLLAINEFQEKRARNNNKNVQTFKDDKNRENTLDFVIQSSVQPSVSSSASKNTNELIDLLLNELAGGEFTLPSLINSRTGDNSINKGPIIADVTDELEKLQYANKKADNSVDFAKEQKNLRSLKNYLNKPNRNYLHSQFKKKNLSVGNVKYIKSYGGNVMDNASIPHCCNSINKCVYHLKDKLKNQYIINENNNVTSTSMPSQQICSQSCLPQNKTFSTPIVCENDFQNLPLTLQNKQCELSQNVPQQIHNLPQTVYDPFETSVVTEPHQICESTSELQNNLIITNESRYQNLPNNLSNSEKPIILTSKSDNTNNLLMNQNDPSLLSTTKLSNTPVIDNTNNTDPIVTFEDSPTSFNTYLNSVDQSINQCRDDIANHWNTVDLDHLLDAQEWQELLNEELAKDDYRENEDLFKLDELMNIPLETPQKNC